LNQVHQAGHCKSDQQCRNDKQRGPELLVVRFDVLSELRHDVARAMA